MSWIQALIIACAVVLANLLLGLLFPGYREMLKAVSTMPGGKLGLVGGYVLGTLFLSVLFMLGWWVVLVWGLINLSQWIVLFLNRKKLA